MRNLIYLLPFAMVRLWGEASFITQMEYASLLYKNPRGIGCDRCHGKRGEGKLIAKYKITKQLKDGNSTVTITLPKEFRAPAIRGMSYEAFSKALRKKLEGMPKYYLTQGEIKALYFYLQSINLKKDQE